MIVNESYEEEFDKDDVEDEELEKDGEFDDDEDDEEDEDMSYADPAEQAADYVGDMEPALGRMGRQYLEELMNIADNNPEVIKQAFGYIEQYKQERFKDMKEVMKVTDVKPKMLKEGYGYIEDCNDKRTANSDRCKGRFLICDADNIKLLTVYFLMKYPDVKPEERNESLEERLKRQGCPEEEAAQEMELMHWYEDLLIRNFRQIYFHQKPPKAVTDQIEEAIRNDRVDDEIRKLARESRIDKHLDVDWRYYLGMSAIHFALSVRLKNLVSVCLALKADTMFEVIDEIDMRGDLNERGGYFDEIFGIDSTTLIHLACDMRKDKILQQQFEHNREVFLACMDEMDFLDYHYLNKMIAQIDPKLHQERAQRDFERQREALIDEFTEDLKAGKKVIMQQYLKGEVNEDALYSLAEHISPEFGWQGNHYWIAMNIYRKSYSPDALYRRCVAALMVCGKLQGYNAWAKRYAAEKEIPQHKEWIREMFRQADEEKIALSYQLNGFMDICDSLQYGSKKLCKALREEGKDIFNSYLDARPEETLEAFRKAEKEGRIFGLQILAQRVKKERTGKKKRSVEKNISAEGVISLFSFAQDKEKEVREALVEALDKAEVFEEDVIGLLASSRAADRETAVKVLVKWNDEKYVPILKEALEKEKSAKISNLLKAYFPAGLMVKSEGKEALEDIVRELHKGNKKRSLAWAYETSFSKVHRKDGQEADEEYLQAILLAYAIMPMKDVVSPKKGTADGKASQESSKASKGTAVPEGAAPYGISSTAAVLAEALVEEEFAVYVNELLDKWTSSGAEVRRRWVLYAAALHGGVDMPDRLYQLFQEWAENSGTVAAEAVRALALSLRPQALLIAEGISRKFKTYKIRNAARKALRTAAAWCETTVEGLLDRTVPDLGFDEKRERCFDYGERRFTVAITPVLEIQAFDSKGKKIKNLPAPTKKDDQTKATVSYEDFKQLKKQLKNVVSVQKTRMETALSNGREWSVQAWKDLFVGNPVMHQFAIGLIWGYYEDRKLVASFRYMEDGSFGAENGEEFALWEKLSSSAQGKIGLVHPIELSKDSLQAWKEQLDDYEIVQPVRQLDRPVFRMTEEEAEQNSMDRYKGWNVESEFMKKQLKKLGWRHVNDEDVLSVYEKENEELSLGVEFLFEYDEWPGSATATLQGAKFYEDDGSGIVRDDDYCLLQDVPERYFSEIVLSLAEAIEE